MSCSTCRKPCLAMRALAVAKSPEFKFSRTAGNQTSEYRQALETAGVKHEDVLAANRLYFGEGSSK